MKVIVKSATDLGLIRRDNEDSHGSWVPADPEELRRRGALLVIADGMGGARAGKVASRMTVDTVLRVYRESPSVHPLSDLRAAIVSANQAVHSESQNHPELGGMGTTCTALVVREGESFVAHVGDTRAYLVRQRRIQQLTRDHSLVAQLVEEHQMSADQARADRRRNVVTRSIGIEPEVDVDADRIPVPLVARDTLLLCTDGLHGLVRDDELSPLASEADLERSCRQMIALARQRGGPDNITVVLARIESDAAETTTAERVDRSEDSRRTLVLLIVAAVGLLVTLAAIGWLLAHAGRGPTFGSRQRPAAEARA